MRNFSRVVVYGGSYPSYNRNFSRVYPRVVVYNGQQNFNMHDGFPAQYREEMVKDKNHPFIKELVSKVDAPTEEGFEFITPKAQRAAAAALATDPEFRKLIGDKSYEGMVIRRGIEGIKDNRKKMHEELRKLSNSPLWRNHVIRNFRLRTDDSIGQLRRRMKEMNGLIYNIADHYIHKKAK